jgi:REP element-mobilizing transposase RayT
MPCYLFAWHAYATWLPDRPQGLVLKGRGVQPPDVARAKAYRARQKEAMASFDESMQRLIIAECIVAAEKRRFRVHGVATEPTHVHVLISWADNRTFEVLRRGLRESISRRLNSRRRRPWLEQGGSRKRVTNRPHFQYLMDRYLPKHGGWKWREGIGCYR